MAQYFFEELVVKTVNKEILNQVRKSVDHSPNYIAAYEAAGNRLGLTSGRVEEIWNEYHEALSK